MTDRPYLLDTNAISDLIRNPRGTVQRRLEYIGEHLICTSIIVACELRYGAVWSGSARLSTKVDDLLDRFHVHPIESPFDDAYSIVRAELERKGRSIGGNDLLIAAHALSLGCVLVTANTREFERVPNLQIENWIV